MPRTNLQSPLLHHEIYREDAVRATLGWYHETYGVQCTYTTAHAGWQLTLVEAGICCGESETLLREIMNMILARSLELRLEDMTA
jgi:hypothetical protein